jgi:hypothetical protein
MPPPRKIEYFSDQLQVSPLGREVLAQVRKHSNEVMYLVNQNRPTMVCWQRNHGPKFIKSIVDSGFEEDQEFVREVNGITLEMLMLNMAEVLQDNGSIELKQAIGQNAAMALKIARETRSLRQLISRINGAQTVEKYG